MAFVVLQNLHSSSLVISSPLEPVAKMIKTLGPDQMTLLLAHHASQQNRNLMLLWEETQIVIGLVLGGCLYFATQKRMLSMVLCGVMLALVLFQFWAVTPELSYRGRQTDFAPGTSNASTLLLYQMLVISEAMKLVVGGILASYLFVFRTSRPRPLRTEVDLIDDPHHSHVDRGFRASD